MRFLTLQRVLLFLHWLGPRFDATDIRYAWHNSRLLLYPLDGYQPYAAFRIWGEWLRSLI